MDLFSSTWMTRSLGESVSALHLESDGGVYAGGWNGSLKHWDAEGTLVWTASLPDRITVLSVSVAFLLFGLLQAASPIFTGQMEGLRADLVMTMSRYNMMGKLPYSHVEFIEEIEGVEAVLYMDYITSFSQDSMFEGVAVAMGGDVEIYDRLKLFLLLKHKINLSKHLLHFCLKP